MNRCETSGTPAEHHEDPTYEDACETISKGAVDVARAVGLNAEHFDGEGAEAYELSRGLSDIAELLNRRAPAEARVQVLEDALTSVAATLKRDEFLSKEVHDLIVSALGSGPKAAKAFLIRQQAESVEALVSKFEQDVSLNEASMIVTAQDFAQRLHQQADDLEREKD